MVLVDPSIVRPIRLWENKKLRFPLIGGALAVLALVAWLVWPGPDLTFRLKIVRTGIEDGKPAVLFRVEGGEPYDVHIQNFHYLLGDTPHGTLSLDDSSPAREFWATDASEYFADVGNQGWKVQANVFAIGPAKKNIRKALWAIRTAWSEYRFWRRTAKPVSFLSLVKRRWNYSGNLIVSRQAITSELITNTSTH